MRHSTLPSHILFCICLSLIFHISTTHAQKISESLDEWILGPHKPELVSGQRPDGTTGDYMHFPIGTDMSRFMMDQEGEGSVLFWIYDPGTCDGDTNPVYGDYGPTWGIVNTLGVGFGIGIYRNPANRGCRGYSIICTGSPDKAQLFAPETRDFGTLDREPRWQLWGFEGTWDDITITHYDTDYMLYAGTDSARTVFGNLSKTFNAASNDSAYASVFGQGWQGIFIKGDDSSGIEAIDFHAMGGPGTGIFEYVSVDCWPPVPPVTITSFPKNDTVVVGSLYTSKITKEGGCSKYHTYTANQAPEGMRLFYITGNIEWTPTEEQIGDNYLVMGAAACTLTVTDPSSIIELPLINRSVPIESSDIAVYDILGRRIYNRTSSGMYITVTNGTLQKKLKLK